MQLPQNRIIVGVKYCFRYNARNRNIRITGEDGEPINLENMPQHPRRRRREKKLMSIDEVNDKFPMMKYKSWVASRAQEGLPTRGGISQPPSRAGSLRDADGIIPVTKERDSTDEVPATGAASLTRQQKNDDAATAHTEKNKTDAAAVNKGGETAAGPEGAASHTTQLARADSPGTDDDEPDEDDQIHDALPPEALESSGDTCAICIDTLEDDDDVRGLTCGHAFHAVCLDPWLTSRRACCPLCKADYYTPKPRPQQVEVGQLGVPEIGPTVSIAQDTRTNRMNMPNRPGVAWLFTRRGGGDGSRFNFPSLNRDRSNSQAGPNQAPPRNAQRPSRVGFTSRGTANNAQTRSSRGAANNTNQNETTTTTTTPSQSGGLLSNLRLPRFGRSGGTQQGGSGNNAEVTPSNLEAGVRADTAR